MTEDEMVGWHHPLNGHEFAQTLGNDEGQGSLVYCSSWDHKKLDMTVTEQQQMLKGLIQSGNIREEKDLQKQTPSN